MVHRYLVERVICAHTAHRLSLELSIYAKGRKHRPFRRKTAVYSSDQRTSNITDV